MLNAFKTISRNYRNKRQITSMIEYGTLYKNVGTSFQCFHDVLSAQKQFDSKIILYVVTEMFILLLRLAYVV